MVPRVSASYEGAALISAVPTQTRPNRSACGKSSRLNRRVQGLKERLPREPRLAAEIFKKSRRVNDRLNWLFLIINNFHNVNNGSNSKPDNMPYSTRIDGFKHTILTLEGDNFHLSKVFPLTDVCWDMFPCFKSWNWILSINFNREKVWNRIIPVNSSGQNRLADPVWTTETIWTGRNPELSPFSGIKKIPLFNLKQRESWKSIFAFDLLKTL